MNNAEPPPRRFTASAGDAGKRLDLFLAELCPDLSRAAVQRALAAGGVAVGGRVRPKSFRLRAGDKIELRPPPAAPPAAGAQDLPLRIVHADAELVVVDKEAGRVVHPAPGHPDGTLVNALLHHCRGLAAWPDALRPGLVHRLDRDTSGLLVVALTESAHRRLAAQLRQRSLGRAYLALSWGRWPQPEGRLAGNLGRHPTRRQRMAVLPAGGRPAATRYRVLEDFGFVQLCRVELETGRTHQIRVHFAHAGHPIVGDRVYGDDARARVLRADERPVALRLARLAHRQLLHAYELALDHPATGERLAFHSPPPPDLAAALALLRAQAEGADLPA